MNNVRTHVLVCTGGGCIASGALEVSAALREQIERHGLHEEIKIIRIRLPWPMRSRPGRRRLPRRRVLPEPSARMMLPRISRTPAQGRVVERLVRKAAAGETVPGLHEIDFFQKQVKIVLRNCGVIDPQRIEEYIARDGYQASQKR